MLDLDPVLRKGERFDLEMAQKEVRKYLASVLMPTKEEEMFWKAFAEGRYCPELIFGDTAECTNVVKHPMALWKSRDKEKYLSLKYGNRYGCYAQCYQWSG